MAERWGGKLSIGETLMAGRTAAAGPAFFVITHLYMFDSLNL